MKNRLAGLRSKVVVVDDPADDAECIVSAETNYSDAAATERRGKCDDRIHEIHFNTHNKKASVSKGFFFCVRLEPDRAVTKLDPSRHLYTVVLSDLFPCVPRIPWFLARWNHGIHGTHGNKSERKKRKRLPFSDSLFSISLIAKSISVEPAVVSRDLHRPIQYEDLLLAEATCE